MSRLAVLLAWIVARVGDAGDDERGSAELTTMIALSFVGVVAVVAIVALLQTLGVDVVNGVRDRIGL